ncbi:hypothetical protein Q9L58_007415 [Maublancomyces gigas]|uniref:Protein kinase domain-containing protein n=1 Tax=Discina gigas TaxID=1032678 RepID=A0ABR3GCJ9_9PEZI
MPTAEESASLNSYQQTAISMNSSATVHHSDSPFVSQYNGTWNRHEKDLGNGSFGIVYREDNFETGAVRAVKKILKGSIDSIMREIQCMIRLREYSSLFVGIQCWWTHNDTIFIAMDYHRWGNLTEYVARNGPFSENDAKDISVQLFLAVLVLHQYSIVHRDIKPENILIASVSPFSIRLADFGLAKFLSPDPNDDTPHFPHGTPAWGAPEQLREDGESTSKVDIWAVGGVLYYLMTSLNPFSDDDRYESTSVLSRYTFPFWPRVSQSQFLELRNCDPGNLIIVPGISYQGNIFLHKLIVQNPDHRLTAREALNHVWVNPTPPHRHRSNVLRVAAAGGYLALVGRVLKAFGTGPVVDRGTIPTDAALIGAAAGGHDKRALEGGHNSVAAELWPHVVEWVNFSDLTDRTTALVDAVAAFGTETFLPLLISHIQSNAVSTLTPYFATMITAAVHHGNIGSLSTLISDAPLGLEFLDSALHSAASSGRLHILEFLLDLHAVIPTRLLPPGTIPGAHDILSSALEAAAEHGHLDILRYLVCRGIAPTKAAIAATVDHGHTKSFQYLVCVLRKAYRVPMALLFRYIPRNGIPHCRLSLLRKHLTPYTLKGHVPAAARLGRGDIVRWLLANVDEPGARRVGLVAAAEYGHVDLVQELSVLAGGGVGEALTAAAKAGKLGVVEVLLGRAREKDVESALEAGHDAGQVGVVVRLLLEREPYASAE